MTKSDLELDNIFIPSKVPSKKLMIILHGRGDSSEGFVGFPPYLDLDDMNQEVNQNNWLCTHGKQDPVLPFETSLQQVKELQDGGFTIEFVAYDKEHNIEADELTMIAKWIKGKSC